MVLDLKVARVYRFNGDGPVKAVCDVSICDEFLIKGFRVIEGKNGLFVGSPSEQGKDGKWYSSVFPLTKLARQSLQEIVLSAYEDDQY